jgi:hypothetical protein
MEFKNYCVVVLGHQIDDILEIVLKISETPPKRIQQKGILICTFSCTMTAAELNDLFEKEGRTYFIFEIGSDSTSYKIGRDDIQEQLFGEIERGGDVLSNMSNKIMDDIFNSKKLSGNAIRQIVEVDIDIENWSKFDKEEKINDLLDKGFDKLDNKEKELLDLLTKSI